MSALRKQSGEFDPVLALVVFICVALLVVCIASMRNEAACAKDPDCRLVLRAHDWQCTADERHGKLTECIRYERVR